MHFHYMPSLLLLAAGTVKASPFGLDSRGMGQDIFQGILTYAGSQFKTVFGVPAACSSEMPSDEEYMTNSGKGDLEIPWAYCYNEGENEFTQADADAAKCLINLHYVQDDKCISVKGSMCEEGYDGMLQNAQISYLYGSYQISSDESWSMQAAIDKMVGAKMKTHKPDYGESYSPVVSLTTEENPSLAYVSMVFRYVGEDEC